MQTRTKILSAAVAVTAALGLAGTGTAVAMDKTVTVQVGSSSRQVSSFGLKTTVSDVLRTGGVVLEGRDTVSPALDAVVADGQVITVTVVRPRLVTVAHDGITSSGNTYETTVAGVLRELGVTLDADDRLSAALDAEVADGATVAKRVAVTQVAETAAVPYASTTVDDATLTKGTTKVTTAGVPGVRTTTFQVTTVDGVEDSRTPISDAVTTPPVTQVTAVGTKVVTPKVVAPAKATPVTTSGGATTGSTALNLANAAMWDRVARCESSNNWSINTGNGYYGGLQFSYSTWLAYGGADFAPRADLATREQQITVANRVYAGSGLSQWGCKG